MLMFRAQYYIQVRQGLRPVFHNFFFFQNWLHQEKNPSPPSLYQLYANKWFENNNNNDKLIILMFEICG